MKDNNNLLSINTWCSGEYTNTINIFKYGLNYQISNEYSTIGETSIKIKSDEATNGLRIEYTSSIPNKKATSKISLKTEKTINILFRELHNTEIISVSYVSFTGEGDVELSLNTTNNNNYFYTQLTNIPTNNIVYMDNISLKQTE